MQSLGVWLRIKETDTETDTESETAGGAAVCLFVSCGMHPRAALYALILCMHGAGLTKEADCAFCAPGKYQTGVALVAEANCTWCVAGKYQSGSGRNAAIGLYLLL